VVLRQLNISKIGLIILCSVSLLLGGCGANYKNRDIFRKGIHGKHVDSFAFYGEEITPEREKELLAENTIYFGYDKDEIQDRYKLVLLAHAKKMLEEPHFKLRVDGHTDERGSAEYNIGLGERRAKSVIRFLEFKGVRSDRLVSVSYGKEKPASVGHKEDSWRLNRRAELAYE
jgi:peptidoglycan-associated lipoprotein